MQGSKSPCKSHCIDFIKAVAKYDLFLFTAAAEAVLDRCVTTSNEYDLNETMVWVNINYEYLDEVCIERSEESLIERRPKYSKNHPLALMVRRYIHQTCNSTQLYGTIVSTYTLYSIG